MSRQKIYKEFGGVIITEPIIATPYSEKSKKYHLPIGSIGTIIDIYPHFKGEAFEVEFDVGEKPEDCSYAFASMTIHQCEPYDFSN